MLSTVNQSEGIRLAGSSRPLNHLLGAYINVPGADKYEAHHENVQLLITIVLHLLIKSMDSFGGLSFGGSIITAFWRIVPSISLLTK